MKKYFLLLPLITAVLPVNAQLTAPGAKGDIDRAEMFLHQNMAAAAIDNLADITLPQTPARLLDEADARFMRGQYAEAAQLYSEFSRIYPANDNAAYASSAYADCLFLLGKTADAAKIYAEVPQGWLNPEREAQTTYRQALCALNDDKTEHAQKLFTKAAANSSTRSAANYYLGVIAFDSMQYSDATHYFALVDHTGIIGIRADWYMAQVDFARQQWSKALAEANNVLRSCPDDLKPEMMRVAGESLCRLDRENEGLEMLRKYVASCKNPTLSALYLIGVDDYRNARYSDAVTRLTPVAEGTDAALRQSAYLFIGQSLTHQGDNDAAILAFNKAINTPSGDPDTEEAAYYNYAVAKFNGATVPFNSAVQTFEDFLKRYPSGVYSERVAEYLAGAFLADKDYQRAVNRIDATRNPSPKLLSVKQKALYALAWNDIQNHNYAGADTYLEKAAQINGFPALAAEIAFLQGIIRADEGNYGTAATLFDRYLRQAPLGAPNIPLANYRLGYALYSQGKAAGADAADRKSVV